jgi:hypothetical protein
MIVKFTYETGFGIRTSSEEIMKKLIILLLLLSNVAHANSILCKREVDRKVEVIEIDLDVRRANEGAPHWYKYDNFWNGSYPTHTSSSGVASGSATNGNQGIEGRFDFVLMNVPSYLEIRRSIGTFVMGADSSQTVGADFECSFN